MAIYPVIFSREVKSYKLNVESFLEATLKSKKQIKSKDKPFTDTLEIYKETRSALKKAKENQGLQNNMKKNY
ncbi:MAG: hypothetical protein KAI43_09055 [Candidatus Aureabacteria bacterium]|nr:hypothetical protein [Candidatus Auribacterota bacterium]